VVVTREKIKEHAEADLRVLLDARRYADRTLGYHARVMRVLEPYFGNEHATVADAARAAARGYGIDPAGHSAEELIDLLLAAASQREAPSTPPYAPTPLQVVPLARARERPEGT